MRDTPDQDPLLDPTSEPTSEPISEPRGLFDFYVQQLEEYLDGELEEQEARSVRQRLAEEPAYAAALDRLHRERAARVGVFEQIEAREIDAGAAARLVASARRMSQQGRLEESAALAGAADTAVMHTWPTWIKVTLGAAACLLVGFGGFLFGGFNLGADPAIPSPTPFTQVPDAGVNNSRLVIYDRNGDVAVSQPVEETPFGQPLAPPEEQILPRDPTFGPRAPR